jgi:CRISPR/Cas system CSM-associated protein Csm2 small subunit
MKNSKDQMLYSADQMRDVLSSIEDLLEGYDGIEGNYNYVKYCYKKAQEAHEIDDDLNKMLEDTYAVDLSQRKGINIAVLIRVIEKMFKLLDDIDTASDMFKPKWCKITQVVEKLQRLRWIYCTVESERNDNGEMVINGECFKKEDRIILALS